MPFTVAQTKKRKVRFFFTYSVTVVVELIDTGAQADSQAEQRVYTLKGLAELRTVQRPIGVQLSAVNSAAAAVGT